jgi:hypothetical protein
VCITCRIMLEGPVTLAQALARRVPLAPPPGVWVLRLVLVAARQPSAPAAWLTHDLPTAWTAAAAVVPSLVAHAGDVRGVVPVLLRLPAPAPAVASVATWHRAAANVAAAMATDAAWVALAGVWDEAGALWAAAPWAAADASAFCSWVDAVVAGASAAAAGAAAAGAGEAARPEAGRAAQAGLRLLGTCTDSRAGMEALLASPAWWPLLQRACACVCVCVCVCECAPL